MTYLVSVFHKTQTPAPSYMKMSSVLSVQTPNDMNNFLVKDKEINNNKFALEHTSMCTLMCVNVFL